MAFSLRRRQLPSGTTQEICGASTSRQPHVPAGITMSARGLDGELPLLRKSTQSNSSSKQVEQSSVGVLLPGPPQHAPRWQHIRTGSRGVPFSRGVGWHVEPTPVQIFSPRFRAVLADRKQEFTDHSYKQTWGSLAHARLMRLGGTRFDPRTGTGCAVRHSTTSRPGDERTYFDFGDLASAGTCALRRCLCP